MFRQLLGIVGLGVLFAAPAGVAQTPRVAEVQIAPPFVRMVPDAQVQASATAYDSAGTPVVVRFRWSSSNINVATVSENGLVHGVAPGTALITAVYEGQRSGRRRAMQVQVMSRGTSVSTVPLPFPAPGMPPAPPGMVMLPPHAMDSAFKSSINCNEPMMNAANPLRACYDQRPTPRVPAAVALASCPGQPNTSVVLVMVRVTETGAVSEVLPFGGDACQPLVDAAVAGARTMTFNPALREGRPVGAWVRIRLRNTEPPPKQ